MKIGVDIDGVLINSQAMWIEKGILFNKYNNIKSKANDKLFLPGDMFGWTDEQHYKFWKEYYEDYFRFSLPSKKGIETIKKLKNEGNEIIIITGRTNDFIKLDFLSNDMIVDFTKEWLKTNEVPYDELIFTKTGTKTKTLLEKKCDIMIDDNFEEVKLVSDVMPIICFKKPYNEDIKNFESNYKIYLTDDWNMVYTIINYRLTR